MDEDSALPDALPTPESNQENAIPMKQNRGRTKTTTGAVSKSKPKPKQNNLGTMAGKKKPAQKKNGSNRIPLKEQSNNQNPEDTEEVDDFDEDHRAKKLNTGAVSADELVMVKQPPKKGRPAAKSKNPRGKKETDGEILKQIKNTADDEVFEYTPTTARQTKATKKNSGMPLAGQPNVPVEPSASEKIIPDTQDVAMEIGPSDFPMYSDGEEEVPQSVFRQTGNSSAYMKQRQIAGGRRQGSVAPDNETGGGDPELRRRLGEMTRRFESLDLKYKRLTDVGIKEAESNFEKLISSSEAKSKAANELIASLKKELGTQKALAQESRTLQKQLVAKDGEVSKAQALATELSSALSEAQNENKVLQARLASTRAATATIESTNSKTPGSAIKGKGPVRTIMVGSAEAAQAAQGAQLKEDLYRDLTGLLILGVEKGTETDTYDCIQTGRNGTLHFKLGVATNTDDSYEDTEFQYTPRLDNDRDRDLLELLPDYLGEEITFSRLNAARFYGRVVETMTKKRMEDDQA
ncbi:MAG: hypothetical protein Q9222_002918 [Ikaeria aurantiellina]